VKGAKKGVIRPNALQACKGPINIGTLYFFKGARANGALVEP
jgi:hypothetical protein